LPQRRNPESPWTYHSKPIVAITWREAAETAGRISSALVRFALPTEAQWEKAARGGLIAAPFAWGVAPPNQTRCDYGRFHQFSIQPVDTFPRNDYGLYAMNGGVCEWTLDWYDRDYYSESVLHDPQGPPHGKERVLRGGSWADCAPVVTNSFRMSRAASMVRADSPEYRRDTPTIGFRLVRQRFR
jgi:formylglycine-generating enzyme required for sulfatase activity